MKHTTLALILTMGVVIFVLSACGPIPVQVSKTSQEQTQRQSNEQTQSASTAADPSTFSVIVTRQP